MTVANQTTFVDVRGKKTQLTIGGQGPPLLYLHSAAGETDWTRWHDALAQQLTVYAPAHPGFALSEGLEEIDDIHDMAWHCVDLLAAVGLDNVPVVGFSLGAWLAVEMAVLRPALVRRLVLIDAAGLHLDEAPIAELFLDDLDRLRRLIFHNPSHPSTSEVFPTSASDPRLLLWLRAREATARVGWNPYLHDPKLTRHLHRIACPTLLIWGDDDRLILPAHGEFYARHIPGARLEMLRNCGHMAPFEATAECAARTLAFLV
ncbi:MAG TPA: alpha/beta hydrolase [Gemmataceae bacterium]|nr:alpha/beta hydrolase [Gemmataceae bacterium]